MDYYERLGDEYKYMQAPFYNRLPDATYNFYSRGSQYGLGISYTFNWNELKKNKKLEKEYEKQQVK